MIAFLNEHYLSFAGPMLVPQYFMSLLSLLFFAPTIQERISFASFTILHKSLLFLALLHSFAIVSIGILYLIFVSEGWVFFIISIYYLPALLISIITLILFLKKRIVPAH
jgi:hypothetical protein